MAYKFQLGKAKLSGSIETALGITAKGGLLVTGSVDLPAASIQNVELANSAVSVAGKSVSLGGSILLDTADVTEGTNLYYTNTRARAAVSVTDAGGDGSLSYDNTTGVISYTGPSATEARAHFSAVDAGGDGSFSYAAGVFTYTGPSAAEATAHFSAATGSAFQNGNISYDAALGKVTLQPVEESWVRQRLSAVDAVKYNNASGSISLQLSGTSLSQNADGLKADLKTKIGAYNNSGSLAYNVANGEFTFSPVDPTWVKGRFSAGAGLDYADGAFSVGTGEVTNAMLAGAIENAKLVNSSVTVTAGGALTGGGTVALGSSITLDVAVNGDALEVTGDAVALKSTIAGARTFSGNVVMSGDLTVNGTTTYLNTTELLVKDALIEIASGSAFAAGQGIRLGTENSLQTVSGFADVGNALSSSLPLVAPAVKAASFYGNLVGSMQLGIEAKSANATIAKNITKATANITLTLPASPAVGQEHRVKCFVADDSSPAVIVAAQSGATIEGVSQVVLQSFGAAISLVWDGSAWMVF